MGDGGGEGMEWVGDGNEGERKRGWGVHHGSRHAS